MDVYGDVYGHLSGRIIRNVIAQMLLAMPCALATPAALSPDDPLTRAERLAFTAMAPPATAAITIPPVPAQRAMTPRLSNVAEALGLPFSGRLEEGYTAFMGGDTDRALAILDAGIKDAWGDQMRFRLSIIRADMLPRTDRIADAEISILNTAAL